MSFRSLIAFILLAGVLVCISCNSKKRSSLFELTEGTGIDFSNDIRNSSDFNIFNYRNFYNGAGAAIGDINNDGHSDVFFTANMGSNKLYLNKGDWKFEDITESAALSESNKWSTGAVMVDINHDGWLDIYVCNAGYIQGKAPESKLYINNHDLSFREAAAEYGLTNKGGYATHAAFFDYDLDGDLDAFIINNSFIPVNTLNYANKRDLRAENWPVANYMKGGGDRLLRNDNGKFLDVSKEAGIYGSLISFGLGVAIGDVNGDHYPDVYISNDFFERDYLYINQRNGTFKDELEQRMQHISLSSMGADMGDVNNDGYADVFVTDMLPDDDYRLKTTSSFESIDVFQLKRKSGFYNQYTQNTLQLNNRNGKFQEIANYSGVNASDWSWGGLLFDADNDGLNDLYICNGIYNDVTDQDFIDFFAHGVAQKTDLTGKKEEINNIISKMPSNPIPNKAFKNEGNLRFSDSSVDWGFTEPSFSNGAAYGDLDNDGDLDLVVNNVNQQAFVYKNNSRARNGNNYIGVQLKGKGQNTFAVGSTIRIFQGDQVLSREILPSRGFQSSMDHKAILGVGKREVDSMIILWPDRSYSKYDKPAINKIHVLEQPNETDTVKTILPDFSSRLFSLVKNNFEKHREDDYTDFYTERNVPFMLSREGPKAACGDVNNDGLIDVYIGGASNQGGQLYLNSDAGFVKKEVPGFNNEAGIEDVAVLFFDSDQDGDLDLFVGSGGNHHPSGSSKFQNRLYRNDGKGNFELDAQAIPPGNMNNAVVINFDFDKDGDLDLFAGGRSVPQQYGSEPQSYLYENNGKGQFREIAKMEYPEISNLGFITGAAWTNVIGDAGKELIVVGEWMAPRILSYDGKKFIEHKTNLAGLYGWWQTVTPSDIDADGDIDLVLGNIGENFYLRPDSLNPVKLWVSDFDKNSTVDAIITRTVQEKDVPVFLKRDLTDQLVSLKKQNLKYVDFAKKSIQELLSEEGIQKAKVKKFNYPTSCIAYNNANGTFSVQALHADLQLSSINAVLCTDIDNDGKTDIITGGNKFSFQPQFSRLDAGFGNVLLNKGNKVFESLTPMQSGIELSGEVRGIIELPSKQKSILFLLNDDYPVLYQKKRNISRK